MDGAEQKDLETRTGKSPKPSNFGKILLGAALVFGAGFGGYELGMRETKQRYDAQLKSMKIPPHLQQLYIDSVKDPELRKMLDSYNRGTFEKDFPAYKD